MKLGMMTNPHNELDREICWASEQGLDFVDIVLEAPKAALETTDWQSVQQTIADSGLGVVCQSATYLPIHTPSPPIRQAALDELRRSVDAAHILGATQCTTHFRGWPAYLPEAAGYEYYRQLYTVLLKHGEERKVSVALKNSADNSHQLKYFREIFHRLPELKLTYDIGHGNVQTAQSMTRDYLFALADRLTHVHLSDNNGSADDNLPLGAPQEGALQLLRELQNLRSFRYDGTITLQIFGDRRWLVESAAMVRDLWPQAA